MLNPQKKEIKENLHFVAIGDEFLFWPLGKTKIIKIKDHVLLSKSPIRYFYIVEGTYRRSSWWYFAASVPSSGQFFSFLIWIDRSLFLYTHLRATSSPKRDSKEHKTGQAQVEVVRAKDTRTKTMSRSTRMRRCQGRLPSQPKPLCVCQNKK